MMFFGGMSVPSQSNGGRRSFHGFDRDSLGLAPNSGVFGLEDPAETMWISRQDTPRSRSGPGIYLLLDHRPLITNQLS